MGGKNAVIIDNDADLTKQWMEFFNSCVWRPQHQNIVDGQLRILSEGKSSKFVDKIDQITFSGRLAAK